MNDRERTTTVETVKGDTHDLLDDAERRAMAGREQRATASGEQRGRAVPSDDVPLGERVEDGI